MHNHCKIILITSHSKLAIFTQTIDAAGSPLTLKLRANCLSRLCMLRELEATQTEEYVDINQKHTKQDAIFLEKAFDPVT